MRTPEFDALAEKITREHLAKYGDDRLDELGDQICAQCFYTTPEIREVMDPLVAAFVRAGAGPALAAGLPAPAASDSRRALAPAKRPVQMRVPRSGLETMDHVRYMAAKMEANALQHDEAHEDGTSIRFPLQYNSAAGLFVEAQKLTMSWGKAMLTVDRVRELVADMVEIARLEIEDPDLRAVVVNKLMDRVTAFGQHAPS